MSLPPLSEASFHIQLLGKRDNMAKQWSKIIGGLKRLIAEFGPIWPKSTKLSGYAESGPYHCEDCEYLKKVDGQIFRDEWGRGRCSQLVVIADSEVRKDSSGLPIVNIEKGCCEFVDPAEEK
jgi:hypothetical protein